MWAEGQLLQSGKYRVVQEIGRGGFGLTYLAVDVFLHRQVVIKTPNQQFRADQDYEKFVRRFQREGQALSIIEHPNVVQVIEYFDQAGMPCLVMAYIEGNTLNERIRSKGRLSQDEAVHCFRKLAEALHYLHQQGLIHCDIHPGNIILQPDGEPVLIDFGSAKLLQPGAATVTTTVNENFAPYEQGNQENRPQATLDVYGLAATLYFALTGQQPQAAMSRKMFGDKLKPPQQICEGIADWLNQAILEGMALEAKDRPVSMQSWIGLLHPSQPPKVKPSPSPNFLWRELGFLLVGYLSIGLILCLAFTYPGNIFEAWAWPWAFAWAVTGAMAVAGAVDSGSGARVLSFSEPVAEGMVRTEAEAVAVAVAVAVVLSWAFALVGAEGMVAESGAVGVAVAVGVAGAVAVAVNKAGAKAVAVGVAVAGAVTVVLAGAFAVAGAGAVILILVGAVAVARAMAGAKAFAEGVAFAWTVAVGVAVGVAFAWTVVLVLALVVVLAFVLLGTGLETSYFGYVSFGDGLGIGFLASIQFGLILGGLTTSEKRLKERYSRTKIFFIVSGISTLGLALGWWLGWWLR
jgi:tRNA A-37 threonylcarbamoyl transferase component Bud32